MDKDFEIQERRLHALETQFRALDHKIDSKFNELLVDCRKKSTEEKLARLDSEYATLKWITYIMIISALIFVAIF